MEFENYLLFLITAFIYIASPGPAVFVAINYGINYGIKNTIKLILGNTMGLGILAFISAIGVGALVVASPLFMEVLKLLGAGVLIYLGGKMVIGSFKEKSVHIKQHSKSFYKEGLMLSLSNPKPIIFFSAIYPQFVDFNKSVVLQFFILGVSFMLISFFTLTLYAILSKTFLKNFLNEKRLKVFNFLSGLGLIVIGIMLLFTDLGG